MRKKTALLRPLLALVFCLILAGCGKLVEGSEATCCGTVVDCAMGTVQAGDRHGRSYISMADENGTEMLFWRAKGCEDEGAELGDYVRIESAIEERTGLLVAANIVVLEGHEEP